MNDILLVYIAFVIITFSSLLSIIGSTAIVISSYKRIDSIYQRLIFMISIADIISSISFILHPFMIPYTYHEYLPFSYGNNITCTIAGFLITFGPLLITFYSFYLSLFFYIKIKYNNKLTETIMIQKHYPFYANIIALTISLGIPTIGVIINGYKLRPNLTICHLGTCQVGDTTGQSCNINTISDQISYILYYIYVAIIMLLALSSVYCCILLYYTVKQTLQKNAKYDFRNSSSKNVNKGSITTTTPTTTTINSSICTNSNNGYQTSSIKPNIMNDSLLVQSQQQQSQSQLGDSCQFNNINSGDLNSSISNNSSGHHQTSIIPNIMNNSLLVQSQQESQTQIGDSTHSHHSNMNHSNPVIQRDPCLISRASIMISHAMTYTLQKQNDSRMIAVRNQAILYSLAYWNSFFWMFAVFITAIRRNRISYYSNNGGGELNNNTNDPLSITIVFLIYIFYPLQGFFNFIIYTRPRYLEYRKNYPQYNRWYAVKQAISLQPVNIYHRSKTSMNRINRNMNYNTNYNSNNNTGSSHQNVHDNIHQTSMTYGEDHAHHHPIQEVNGNDYNYDDFSMNHRNFNNDNDFQDSSSSVIVFEPVVVAIDSSDNHDNDSHHRANNNYENDNHVHDNVHTHQSAMLFGEYHAHQHPIEEVDDGDVFSLNHDTDNGRRHQALSSLEVIKP